MTRYQPVLTVSCGGTDISSDVLELEVNQTITHKAPTAKMKLDNRGERWDTAFESYALNPSVIVKVDGTSIFKGCLDLSDRAYSKPDGLTFDVFCRGDFGLLDDYVSTLYFTNTYPYDIVNTIINNEYPARKGSLDPSITIGTNHAPTGMTGYPITVTWKRMSLARMLQELVTMLSAPTEPGVGLAYDFWVDPSDKFYFMKSDETSSGVDIPANTETMTSKRTVDRTTLRKEVWLWGDTVSGRIPLTMQPNYPGSIADTWTEGNANEWINSNDPTTGVWHWNSNVNLTHPLDSLVSKVGTYSLELDLNKSRSTGDPYWAFKIPFPTNGSKWPGQSPGGHMNCYNECQATNPVGSGLTESMGALSALNFWLINPTDPTFQFQMYVQVEDGTGRTANSSIQRFPPSSAVPADTWSYYTFPFGPSGSYIPCKSGTTLDWTDIAIVRFCLVNGSIAGAPGGTSVAFYFDGFSITKPLIVLAADSPKTLCRSEILQRQSVTDYATGYAMAKGELLQINVPQIYWTFENLGRTDIPVGYTFTVGGSLTLLIRELRMNMTKRKGWLITAKGFEAV
jgi:hypothetical protein